MEGAHRVFQIHFKNKTNLNNSSLIYSTYMLVCILFAYILLSYSLVLKRPKTSVYPLPTHWKVIKQNYPQFFHVYCRNTPVTMYLFRYLNRITLKPNDLAVSELRLGLSLTIGGDR